MNDKKLKAIITVIGQDQVGIIARISALLMKNNINILDINQTIMSDLFTMMMSVEFTDDKTPLSTVSDELDLIGKDMGLSIKIQHEGLFNSMHRI